MLFGFEMKPFFGYKIRKYYLGRKYEALSGAK